MLRRGSDGRRGLTGLVVALAAGAVLAAGCQGGSQPESSGSHHKAAAAAHKPAAEQKPAQVASKPRPKPKPQATITVSPAKGATDVRPDEPVTVRSSAGKLSRVSVVGEGGGRVDGTFNTDHTSWTASAPLDLDATYRVAASALDSQGLFSTVSQKFSTLDPQAILGTDIYPLDGQTVGVGMPIIIRFSAPVASNQRAALERRLTVTSSRHVEGAWHWFSDSEVHWRPRNYWPANTDVTLRIDTRGANSGNGAWGIKDKVKRFHIGRSVVTKTNLQTHQMRVYVDGSYARTIPISAGKPGWETRSGTKVVLQRRTDVNMRSETVGVSNKKDPNYYDVMAKYALRVTWSGEFLHSAPWSVAFQGRSNTSHGCVGMSTENAGWLWRISQVGDPAETTGSHKYMPVTGNGYGDWNLSWAAWLTGSALH